MCGIAGGMGLLGQETLDQMAQKISHRGPDNISTEIIGQMHLAHTRLSIIDLSVGSSQPLWDATRVACIVFNGEIYNYKSLRDELLHLGVKFNTDGDAEVLLNLYLQFGTQLFEKVSGIFTFAIWDNSKQELLLARDHFGVKPLYYSQNEKGLYFASEIKSLLEVDSIKRELNCDALYRTLIFLWSPGRETLLANVYKVEPGHYLRVKNKKIVEDFCYWSLPSYCEQSQDESVIASQVLERLRNSVKEQLVSDVPVGAFLSGGLDSSLLVALARESYKEKIQCFTIDSSRCNTSNDGFTDDLPYAKKVAEYLGVDLDVLTISPDIVKLLPKMIYHLDELQADPAPINVMLISKMASEKGYKVLLSGAGGDDVFSGYRRHYAIKSERYWSWLPRPFRSLLKHSSGLLPKKYAFCRRVAKAFSYADLPQEERLLSYFYWMDPIVARELFNDNIKNQISKKPMGDLIDKLAALPYEDPLEKMLFLEKSYFMVDHNFNYTDKMSMAYGVEVRVPFLDKNVVEFAAGIKSSLKQNGRVGKWILKKAAESVLPKSVIYRPKAGFGAPLREWLKTDLAPYVDDMLSSEKIRNRGVFDPEKVQALIDADRSGKEDYSYSIFALLCFEIWSQLFLDVDNKGIKQ